MATYAKRNPVLNSVWMREQPRQAAHAALRRCQFSNSACKSSDALDGPSFFMETSPVVHDLQGAKVDLIDRLRDLAARAQRVLPTVQTEEAAKNAFVMPFINALGYDVFNPEEVIPELVADVGIKKGEKVDYAIRKDGKIILLIECKWCGRDLRIENAAQLFRYFTIVEARCAILTNGLVYQFYTDIDEPNKMDQHSFFVFNLLDFTDAQVDEVKKFSKSAFDLGSILGTAANLKFTNMIKAVFAEELANPSEELVKLFTSRIYSGRLTQSVKEQFTGIVRTALQEFVRERVSDRLKSALQAEVSPLYEQPTAGAVDQDEADVSDIETSEEELEGFRVIKAIARRAVDVSRISIRDAKSYCAILLDNNNRKPVARLHFNGQSRHYLGLFTNKIEEKVLISKIDDLYDHAERIVATIKSYLSE